MSAGNNESENNSRGIRKLSTINPIPDNVMSTRLITTAAQVRMMVVAVRSREESIGFVPTMGALHAGHLSLVEASLTACDRTVVSIFVNPTQFGPGEDLQSYPRALDEDLRLLEKLGCWLVFAPSRAEMYPPGSETLVDVGPVARPLEGLARPDHFRGVATVVLKLFQIVPANRAFFGQKDYQQTLVVRQMVRDLSVPIDIEVCPTVREPDGLAMSSRNTYLSCSQRQQASSLWQAMQLADRLHAAGEKDVAALKAQMFAHFAALPAATESAAVEIEYIAFLEAGTVQSVTTIQGPTVIAIAARVGRTRLIDNHTIG